MPVPDYQSLMLPLLELADEYDFLQLREAIDLLALRLNLTEDDKRELLPGGRPRFYNRITWAQSNLAKAGLLEFPKRGHFRITERGRSVLAGEPARVDNKFLVRFEEFKKYQDQLKQTRQQQGSQGSRDSQTGPIPIKPEIPKDTPEENLHKAYVELKEKLAAELLQGIMESPPEFFERLVVKLLDRMGYGGSEQEVGEAIGGSGDEGIDGVIKQDRLGLEVIYIQAKRWENAVGRPEVQKFAGALQGQKARKGVFITTSTFTSGAKEYVTNIDTKIVLIEGTQLAEFMIDHDVGVTTEETYRLKRIDSDYFSEM
ncbi:MAG: restriction endonuclease [Truepera sp.]|nr:restriction endonuclease [Truepera sp.]